MPLSTSHPDLAAQWHTTRNGLLSADDVRAGTSSKVWWRCSKGHEWDDTPNHRTHVERAIKRWWRVDLGLPASLGPPDMPQTGGWSETVSVDGPSAFECIERIRTEAASTREPQALHVAPP